MCRILTVFKAVRLLNIHLFLDRAIEEGACEEPPKVLGPPTDVLVLRTLDSHAGAHNDSTSSVICIFIISPKST
jgi:hypothetical protein